MTLPRKLALRLVYAALVDAIARVDRAADHNRRGPPTPAVQTARWNTLAQLRDQKDQVYHLMRDEPRGVLPAAWVALLAAWAMGHLEAIGAIERAVLEAKHPAAERLADLSSEDVAGACRLLMEG